MVVHAGAFSQAAPGQVGSGGRGSFRLGGLGALAVVDLGVCGATAILQRGHVGHDERIVALQAECVCSRGGSRKVSSSQGRGRGQGQGQGQEGAWQLAGRVGNGGEREKHSAA